MQDFRANEAETVSGQVRSSDISYAAYVGLDVHKDTIAVAVAMPGREEPVYRGEIKNQRKSLVRLIRSLSAHGEVWRFCYEARPCGTGCIATSPTPATTAMWWRRA